VRNLSLGDRGKEVTDVQTRLRALGIELGSEGVDGFYGPRTLAAVKAFQQERGLLADGIIGANTWCELVEAGYALGDRLLYLRVPPYRGDDVLALQVKLNLLGFNAGPERGIHDEAVEEALLEFQRNAGLPADGIVGESTLRKLDALRKAEAGREGKKIPERDAGFLPELTLAGQTIVIDPGHGGEEPGWVSSAGLVEKQFTLAAAQRLGQLLEAQGCRVALTRSTDHAVSLYDRCETANALHAAFFISLHLNHDAHVAAGGAVCYFFQRSHYYSEHGRRAADAIGAHLRKLGGSFIGSFGRNYALLREPRAIALIVEPFFISNPAEERRAGQPDYADQFARAVVAGLADYMARRPAS
jgi:N-acetylmuramoyl-L-alanine amidase